MLARAAEAEHPVELDRLLAAADEPYRLLFTLAAETGARLGEVLGLTWADVDTASATVTFTAQLDRKGERVPLKPTAPGAASRSPRRSAPGSPRRGWPASTASPAT